jgi:hypothetical protein
MAKNSVDTPNERVEYEHNIFLLIEEVYRAVDANDEASLGSLAAFTIEPLKKVRKLPNGRINLITIDESLRLQGNMRNTMQRWDDLGLTPKPERIDEEE